MGKASERMEEKIRLMTSDLISVCQDLPNSQAKEVQCVFFSSAYDIGRVISRFPFAIQENIFPPKASSFSFHSVHDDYDYFGQKLFSRKIPLCTASHQLIKNTLPLTPHPDVGRGLHHNKIFSSETERENVFFTQTLHFTTFEATVKT